MDRSSPRPRPSGESRIHEDHPVMAGIEVREEDIDEPAALHIAGIVFRISSVVILLLAIWQAWDWFRDPPPGNTGLSVIIGDTIRLIVTSALLFGAADLADVIVKGFHEMRATRILLSRQTYLIRQMGISSGDLPRTLSVQGDRRGVEPEDLPSPPGE